MADDRTYIRVHDGIEDHPKIAPLSDAAFRLLVTTWGWCSRHRTDGRVPPEVWKKRGTKRTRAELEAAGLVDVQDGRPEMHDYLEHQRSAALIEEKKEAKRRAGAVGNHRRWHVPHGKYDPDCPLCIADASHVRSQTPSQNGSGSDRKTSPETETETETETDIPMAELVKGGHQPARARDSPPPPRCPRHLNDPDPPNCGQCADARRDREAWDVDQIRAALEAERAEKRAQAEIRRRAIDACDLCDSDGYVGRVLCDHDPDAANRAARGREAVTAALSSRKDTQS